MSILPAHAAVRLATERRARRTYRPDRTWLFLVATADPDSELAWLVGEAGCGWAAPPDDVAAMVAAANFFTATKPMPI